MNIHLRKFSKDSKVMDIATGSAAFLVAAMDLMITDANNKLGKNTSIADERIAQLKKDQLLGIEIDAKMYTLAATNMILRGDGSSNILKADSFKTPEEIFKKFAATKLLLNPPFSSAEFGLPFFEFGLSNMEKNGIGAVIIQDSAGAGKAVTTAKRILKKHTMLASIKMPSDLFVPNAIVQTSIYIFKAGTPHNYGTDIVKFIDFRNDGYKRTERVIKENDSPIERYNDLYYIYKLGKNAPKSKNFHKDLWNLDLVYAEDVISEDGNDWNADRHIKVSATSQENTFTEGLKKYFSWDLTRYLENYDFEIRKNIRKPFKESKKPVSEVFTIKSATPSYDKGDLVEVIKGENSYDYITRTSENQGVCCKTGYISDNGLQASGTFSLGLMQKIFYYRKNKWYAGQFVKVVSCIEDVSEEAKLYLETILNGLTPELAPYLVRYIEQVFNDLEVTLPVKKNNQIDYEWMELYIKEGKKLIKEHVKDWLDKNWLIDSMNEN